MAMFSVNWSIRAGWLMAVLIRLINHNSSLRLGQRGSNDKWSMYLKNKCCFLLYSPLRSHQPHQIQSWGSPSYPASFLPTPTPVWPQTTLSLRRSAPQTAPSSTILRGTSLRRRKFSASTSTQSSTCPCFSCTVRCLCAPRDLWAAKDCPRYAV